MRTLDGFAIEKMGIPSLLLMENAGERIFQRYLHLVGPIKNSSVVIVCGPGNNGGDGFVLARKLSLHGISIHVFLVGANKPQTPDAAHMHAILANMSIPVTRIIKPADLPAYYKALRSTHWVVDALFGVGFNRELNFPFTEVIQRMNDFQKKKNSVVLSLDVPSGLDATTGHVANLCVQADHTFTLGFAKRGFYTDTGDAVTGQLHIIPFAHDVAWVERTAPMAVKKIVSHYVRAISPKRGSTAHKKKNGHVAVVAGCREMSGAAVLASKACMRTGAGLTTLFIVESAHTIVKRQLVEVMSQPLADKAGEGILTREHIPSILKELKNKQSLLIGPGLKSHPQLKNVLLELIEEAGIPTLIDAQALTTLGTDIFKFSKKTQARLLLTPHPGEMARLTARTTDDVQKDRYGTLSSFTSKFSGATLLKGAYTLIATPKETWICPVACPALATAGTGDVLAGMAATFLAQGTTSLNAGILAAWYHAQAGLRIQRSLKGPGIIASDLLTQPLIT